MTVATGENWIGKFSNKELREIFGWKIDYDGRAINFLSLTDYILIYSNN